MSIRPVRDLWDTFVHVSMPEVKRNSEQYREMRRAFYAGANGLFASILSGLDPKTEPTLDDMKRLDIIVADFQLFLDDIKAGRA